MSLWEHINWMHDKMMKSPEHQIKISKVISYLLKSYRICQNGHIEDKTDFILHYCSKCKLRRVNGLNGKIEFGRIF